MEFQGSQIKTPASATIEVLRCRPAWHLPPPEHSLPAELLLLAVSCAFVLRTKLCQLVHSCATSQNRPRINDGRHTRTFYHLRENRGILARFVE